MGKLSWKFLRVESWRPRFIADFRPSRPFPFPWSRDSLSPLNPDPLTPWPLIPCLQRPLTVIGNNHYRSRFSSFPLMGSGSAKCPDENQFATLEDDSHSREQILRSGEKLLSCLTVLFATNDNSQNHSFNKRVPLKRLRQA